MPLDFPTSPTVGQTYAGPTGVIWSWDGAKWTNATLSTGYAPIASPVFTGDPQAPTAAPGDADTSVATTAFVQAATATALHNVGRNLIHNPLFNVAQRGVGPFNWTGSGGYTLDRWRFDAVGADGVSVTQTANSDAGRTQLGDEAAGYVMSVGVTGTSGSGAATISQQYIEGVRRVAGKTVTVSFWAAASAALKLGVGLTQNFGTGGSPSAAVSTAGQAVTLTTTLTRYTLTFAVPSASGKTLGTNSNDSTSLCFYFSGGSTWNTLSGNVGVQSGTINLWGVQLEVGSVATPLEKPDPQQDLAKCQRFYQSGGFHVLQGYHTTGNNIAVGGSFPVSMRAVPTLTPSWSNVNITGPNLAAVSGNYFQMWGSVTTTGSATLSPSFTASADL